MRQISNWIFYNVSDFDCSSFAVANFSFVHQNRARISKVLLYGEGSVSKVILLG